jgi:hypothetical protein
VAASTRSAKDLLKVHHSKGNCLIRAGFVTLATTSTYPRGYLECETKSTVDASKLEKLVVPLA